MKNLKFLTMIYLEPKELLKSYIYPISKFLPILKAKINNGNTNPSLIETVAIMEEKFASYERALKILNCAEGLCG